MKCEICRKEIIRRRGRQKYCKGCFKINRKRYLAIYSKKWREKKENRERANISHRRSYQKNKDKMRETWRKWRLKHPSIITERTRKWRKKNPIKVKSYNYTQRNKLKKDKCEICNSKKHLHFHHTNYKKNIGVTVCAICHSKIHRGDKN